ncbi:amino acid permease [Paraburkholderia haematera]|uniref:GABA permease n=1 Tax=Paraburkholderia haematera TaxID=2793077 RepID=A0ABM8SGW8_9BURK|nr:amino acid permease [Paraburkholderia haematera]CAE6809078.1 GABA permease [Paraburkholderia haematera]
MTQQHRRFDTIVDREKGLHRSLSTGQLSMIAIGGAIGTGLFLGSGFAIGFAGPSVLISYAIGALIALLLMGCLAEMTVAHPVSGSFGAYAEYYIGPLAGFLVRYAYWSSLVFAVGTEVTAIAVYMKYWFPSVPGWYWIIGFSAALIGINLLSVKVFGAVEYVFSMMKIIAIVGFIILGAYVVFSSTSSSGVGFSNYTSHGGFFPKGVWGTWVAVIVAIISYLSIEMIAVAAGEAHDPQVAITKAFRVTMLRLVIFYLLTLALMLAIVPWNLAGTDESPFVRVMAATQIPGAAGAINFVILVAALSAMNSQLYIATRMMFSLSRAGQAPRLFGRLNSRGIPGSALFLSTIGIALATALNLIYPGTAFVLMLSVSMFGAMFAWLMIFVTHLFFRRRNRDALLVFRMWGFPVTTIFGILLIISSLITTYFTREFKMTLITGVPFLLILSLIYFTWFRKNESTKSSLISQALEQEN